MITKNENNKASLSFAQRIHRSSRFHSVVLHIQNITIELVTGHLYRPLRSSGHRTSKCAPFYRMINSQLLSLSDARFKKGITNYYLYETSKLMK